jgi:hypothetical protein
MHERDLTKYLIKQCKALDVLADKFESTSGRARPDWLLTYKRMILVELKAPGKKPTVAQDRDHVRRIYNGAEVVWTDSKEGIDVILQHLVLQQPLTNYKY